MNTFLMAANWKMFKTRDEAYQTLTELGKILQTAPKNRDVAVFAPFTCLSACSEALSVCPFVRLGGQNVYPAKDGAFTGEISPGMLVDCGCSMVLTGHSERRSLFKESDAFVGEKTAFALKAGLSVILCAGETLEERDAGGLKEVLFRQLEAGLEKVDDSISPDRLSVAYEPVWAIGTGRVANEAEIVEAHALAREFLVSRFKTAGDKIRILYGGSVKPENAGAIIGLDNVNGVLVGGASLKAQSFADIITA